VEQVVRIIAEVATVVMPRDTVWAVKADPSLRSGDVSI
jgi:hypothetical protein